VHKTALKIAGGIQAKHPDYVIDDIAKSQLNIAQSSERKACDEP
jgi:hypothetical protein